MTECDDPPMRRLADLVGDNGELANAGFEAWQMGRLDEAWHTLDRLRVVAAASADQDAMFHAVNLLACVAFSRHRTGAAREYRIPVCCQETIFEPFLGALKRPGSLGRPGLIYVRVEFGSGWSEEPAVRVECRSRRKSLTSLSALPGPPSAVGVEKELAVDSVADSTLQSAQRFLVGLAILELAFVADAAAGLVGDLGHGDEVNGVVEVSVAAT